MNNYSLHSLSSMVAQSRKVYETSKSSGADIHLFINKYQSAISALQLLEFKLSNNYSEKSIQEELVRCRAMINDLICFVGKGFMFLKIFLEGVCLI